MNQEQIAEAAQVVWSHWSDGRCMEAIPDGCRPRNVRDAYAVQAALQYASGDRVAGWKIAATSKAGQAHIAVDGPLAGRLFERRIHRHPARIPWGANSMRVAEAEFAFVLKRDIPAREEAYAPSEMMEYVEALHPAIEIPDSRFQDFTKAGAMQLIADNACAHWFVLGEATDAAWQDIDLIQHQVLMRINGEIATRGRGSDVLGDPRAALAWIANSHGDRGEGLRAAQIITTGVCGKPSPISPGDHVAADFGLLGQVTATFEINDWGKQ
jgi:2-keto-4-pentenoate hydratase